MKNPEFNLAAPISIVTVTEKNRRIYRDMLREAEVKRVWFCGHSALIFECDEAGREAILAQLKDCIDYFSSEGFEVGAWTRAFGFGTPSLPAEREFNWTRLKSVTGAQPAVDAYCPDDPGFREAFYRMIRDVASCEPSLIMLDDDLCLSVRPGIGCFCDRHLARMSEKLGETVTLDGLAAKIFTGGANKYRTAWLEACGESLVEFCAGVRAAVDTVDETIRCGFASGFTSWDIEGVDAPTLTRVLAGGTKPFLRLTGAPYWCRKPHQRFVGQRMNAIIESCREQISWSGDLELFAENDGFPRPAHQVPARLMEDFSLGMAAIGADELKYFFDYFAAPDYETLYLRSHLRNQPKYRELRERLAGLEDVGVRLYRPMRRIENANLGEQFPGERTVMRSFFSGAAAMLTQLSIPVCYEGESRVGAAFGDDAMYVGKLPERLILDLPAAILMKKRGFDVGLESFVSAKAPELEIFNVDGETRRQQVIDAWLQVGAATPNVIADAKLSPNARVMSEFLREGVATPSSYRYESDGCEYFVLLFDATLIGQSSSLEGSYYRQQQLFDFVGEYPRVARQPELYSLCRASADGSRQAAFFENLGEDSLFDAKIELPKPCRAFELSGAKGRLTSDGLAVELDELRPGSAILLTVEY